MAVYPLTPFKKGSNTLNPHSSYYTEEYAQNLCGWYLTDQISRNKDGEVQVRYRLHSNKPRTFSDFMTKDIMCPKCGQRMHPVASAIDHYDLALYACHHCDMR